MPAATKPRLAQRRASALSLAERLLAPGTLPEAFLWGVHLAPDVHVRVAARAVVIGRAPAVAELEWLFRPILTFGSRFCCFWPAPDGETVAIETDMLVASAGAPLPIAMVLRTTGERPNVQDLRFYFDPAPLEAQARVVMNA